MEHQTRGIAWRKETYWLRTSPSRRLKSAFFELPQRTEEDSRAVLGPRVWRQRHELTWHRLLSDIGSSVNHHPKFLHQKSMQGTHPSSGVLEIVKTTPLSCLVHGTRA